MPVLTNNSPAPILCDLDGVVWLSHQPIPGAVEAIAALRKAGHRVLFVTNNSSSTVESQQETLASIGIPAVGDVLTASGAAATLLQPGQRVMVAGGPGVVEAVTSVGALVVARSDDRSSKADQLTTDQGIDAVVVGFHRTFDFESLQRASRAVRNGAMLIGTNSDATYPTNEGLIPGGGSILAAVATASGVEPVVTGKPNAPMGELVRRTLKMTSLENCWMLGDRYSTDGVFAKTIGAKFALVTSGVSSPAEAKRLQIANNFALIVKNLPEFAAHLGVAV